MVAKDKAVKKTVEKSIISNTIKKDIEDACVIKSYQLPKTRITLNYCISCGVHMKLVNKN